MANPMRQNVNTWNKTAWWGNVQPLLPRILNEETFTHRFTYQGVEYKVRVMPDEHPDDNKVIIHLIWRRA